MIQEEGRERGGMRGGKGRPRKARWGPGKPDSEYMQIKTRGQHEKDTNARTKTWEYGRRHALNTCGRKGKYRQRERMTRWGAEEEKELTDRSKAKRGEAGGMGRWW